MNQHIGEAGAHAEGPPEPSFAERARTLAHIGRTGTLATLSRRHNGHPFASVMPYALDGVGRPLVLISAMAMHTQNLGVDRRASLLITQPDPNGDPLASGRLTLMGEAVRLHDSESAEGRSTYLLRHECAGYWADFEDFAFWRLNILDVYFVGGFAAMGWVTAGDYTAADVDPLADSEAAIVAHMNRDHADALIVYGKYYTGEVAEEATMVTVDRLGFKLRLRQRNRVSSVRVAFPREVRTPEDCRNVLIDMLRRATAV